MSEPKVEQRGEQPFVAIRSQISMQELGTVIPQSMAEVFGWLGKKGVPPTGAPFVRYLVINMPGMLEIEVGVPVANALAGEGRIAPGAQTAGRYVTLLYTGEYPGLYGATASLLDWVAAHGLRIDQHPSAGGDVFGGRFEWYLTDPAVEPNPSKWQTEIAMRLAD